MTVSRRTMLGGSMLLTAAMLPLRALAQDSKKITPDKALARLTQGNRKHAAGESTAKGGRAPDQEPWATIVCCSDSRVPPELIFGVDYGELFVVRNAGNTASTVQSLGSVEYSVLKFEVPVIIVLGHSQCGAVEGATDVVRNNATFPGSIGPMVEPILPAALLARTQPGDPVVNGTRENVIRVRNLLRSSEQPILYPPYHDRELQIVGAIYNLDSGIVDFLPG